MKANFALRQKKAKVPGEIKKKKSESYFVFLHKTLVKVLVNILYYTPFPSF